MRFSVKKPKNKNTTFQHYSIKSLKSIPNAAHIL